MNDVTWTTPEGKERRLEFAEHWNELSRAQLLYIAGEWQTWRQVLTHYHDSIIYFQIKLLFVLGNIKSWNFLSRKRNALFSILPSRREYLRNSETEEFMERYEHLPRILKLTEFIIGSPVYLTKNRFPQIRAGQFTLHGPSDELSSSVFKEFVFVDSYFIAWLNTQKVELLDEMVAMLYRPAGNVDVLSKDYLGDQRAPFNNMAYDKWLPSVKKLPLNIKTAIALFYQGCRQNFEQKYPEVFTSAEDRGGGNEGWFQVLSELPAEKFGTISEREYAPLDTVFSELRRIINAYHNKE